jgi:hypothetical protein
MRLSRGVCSLTLTLTLTLPLRGVCSLTLTLTLTLPLPLPQKRRTPQRDPPLDCARSAEGGVVTRRCGNPPA